jgi:hypothetical protein
MIVDGINLHHFVIFDPMASALPVFEVLND